MRRFLPLITAMTLSLGFASGCLVGTRSSVVGEYRFRGPHPLEGGGWCFIEGVHAHPYAPEYRYYSYSGTDYAYAGPVVVWYFGGHPLPSGGYCNIGGRHSHNFTPGRSYANLYSWDRGRSVYVYQGRHGASSVPRAPGAPRPPVVSPPPGRPAYPAPPPAPPPGRPQQPAPPPPPAGNYGPPPGPPRP